MFNLCFTMNYGCQHFPSFLQPSIPFNSPKILIFPSPSTFISPYHSSFLPCNLQISQHFNFPSLQHLILSSPSISLPFNLHFSRHLMSHPYLQFSQQFNFTFPSTFTSTNTLNFPSLPP